MKKSIWYFSLALVFLVSCQKENDLPGDVKPELTTEQKEVISYFKEVALGFEFGGASMVTRKWSEQMKIFIGGKESEALHMELLQIIKEINDLSTDGFSITIVSDSTQSNFYVFFGGASEYAAIYPWLWQLTQTNWGLFSVNFGSSNELNGGHMYVDIDRADLIEQKHLLREELTQSLGFGKDSEKYVDSIFQSQWTRTNGYSEIDKEIIKLLYHPQMEKGLSALEVDEVLYRILIGG